VSGDRFRRVRWATWVAGALIIIGIAAGIDAVQRAERERASSFFSRRPVEALAFSPDGTVLASIVAEDRFVTLRSLDSALVETIEAPATPHALAFIDAPGDTELAIVHWERDMTGLGIAVWSPAEHRFRRHLRTLGNYPESVAISPDAAWMAIGTNGSTVELFPRAPIVSPTPTRGSARILAADGIAPVAFSPSGKRLVTSGPKGATVIYDLATFRAERTIQPPIVHPRFGASDDVLIGYFREDGKQKAGVRVCSALDGSVIREIAGIDLYQTFGLARDGSRVAIAGAGPSVELHDVATGTLLQYWNMPEFPSVMAISPRGDRVAVGDKLGGVVIFPVDPR
jgi:WD40 repeat protein